MSIELVDLLLSMAEGVDPDTFDDLSLKTKQQLAKEITDKEVRLWIDPATRQLYRFARNVRVLIVSRGLFLIETGRGYPKPVPPLHGIGPPRLELVTKMKEMPQTYTETRKLGELASATAVRGVTEEGKPLPPGAKVEVVNQGETHTNAPSRVYHNIISVTSTIKVQIHIPDPSWWNDNDPFRDTDGVESYPKWRTEWPFPLPFQLAA